MGELITKLGIDWRLLIANTITFFIVFWVLRKYAFGPILSVLDKRQATIQHGLEDAKRSSAELAAIQDEKQVILKQAKTEALAIVAEAKQQGEAIKQKLHADAQAAATHTLDQAKRQLERERQAMVSAAKGELADLIVDATTKVLHQTLDTKQKTQLTHEAVAALKEVSRA